MNIYMIDASPKKKKSISGILLKWLNKRLESGDNKREIKLVKYDKVKDSYPENADAIIIAFPLYIDAVPSNLLQVLEFLEESVSIKNPDAKVYVISNNGFYESHQNNVAIRIMKSWCKTSRLEWGRALAIGGGPMIMGMEIGKSPLKKIGRSLEDLAATIIDRGTGEDILTEPDVPRFLYKASANKQWTKIGKKLGLSKKQLKTLSENANN